MYQTAPPMQTALDNPSDFRWGYLFELNFSGGIQRMITMSATKIWNGQSWNGVGDFRLTGSFKQSTDSSLQNFMIAISTRDPAWLDRFSNQSKGRLFRWWRCAINVDGDIVIDPIQRPTMRMVPGRVASQGDDMYASLTLEDMFNQSRKRAPRTRSHFDQKTLFAPPLGENNDECFYDTSTKVIGSSRSGVLQVRQHF
jgi:hypothetical protein